jgi:hypothetical protein
MKTIEANWQQTIKFSFEEKAKIIYFPLARLNLVSNTKLRKINQILFGFKHSSLL